MLTPADLHSKRYCDPSGAQCTPPSADQCCVLQDAPVTNAGTGSNLTECGAVECDAGLMDGGGGFGAIGAAPGAQQCWLTPDCMPLKLAC